MAVAQIPGVQMVQKTVHSSATKTEAIFHLWENIRYIEEDIVIGESISSI
jgi:hypothetical protein